MPMATSRASPCATSTPSVPTPRLSLVSCRAVCRKTSYLILPRLLPVCGSVSRSSATITRPDGSNIRDYIDVVDLARAHVVAIARLIEEKNKDAYEIFNVGTGNGVSVLELVHRFEEANNLKLNYKIADRRTGDIIAIWADPTLANEELGWHATRNLDDTLRSAWAWEKRVRGIEE